MVMARHRSGLQKPGMEYTEKTGTKEPEITLKVAGLGPDQKL